MRQEIRAGCDRTSNSSKARVPPNLNPSGLNDTPRRLHLRVGGMFACHCDSLISAMRILVYWGSTLDDRTIVGAYSLFVDMLKPK